MLLDVARAVAFEACLARGSCDRGDDGGSGIGLANTSNIGMDLIGASGSVEIEMGVDVSGGGVKGFCMILKGVLLLVDKSVGAMSVVVLICTVTCTVIKVVEAGGMMPRIRLGVEC